MKRKRTSNHHVRPVSRGGQDSPINIAKVDARQHNDYHRLFANRTPTEIIKFLVDKFWKGQWGYVDESLVIEREEFEKKWR